MRSIFAMLSLATDLANGRPDEQGLQVAAVAAAIARALGECEDEVIDVALLRYLGCTAYSVEEAQLAGGDDVAFRRVFGTVDPRAPLEVAKATAIASMRGEVSALSLARGAAREGLGAFRRHVAHASCDAALRLATDLGAGPGVVAALACVWERWDGRGEPEGLAGSEIPLAMRIVHAAEARIHGDLSIATGARVDPRLAEAAEAVAIDGDPWARLVVDHAPLGPAAAAAFADFADLKSRHRGGHGRAVARLARDAAMAMGLPKANVDEIEVAALVHDLGFVAVPTGLLDRAGPLGTAGWERVRLHPYLGARILERAARAAAAIVLGHHERRDGSGYPAAVEGERWIVGARIVAAADELAARMQSRAHRPAIGREAAARALVAGAREGRLDRSAVDAVLAAAGHDVRPRRDRTNPAGLSDREVEVLARLADGETNRAIAAALGLSPRTVQHHVEHVYAKIGVRSRAGATLFAVRHGLVGRHEGSVS
jgi:HD-GYP domain-containing protein (c-di-GMP phosphodiesterase class II)